MGTPTGTQDETTQSTSNRSRMQVFLAIGFRPFYLLAGVYALLALPIWMAWLFGHGASAGYLQGLTWHSHEMIFGFAAAVISGFLLTAVRNWTGRTTPDGVVLGGLVLLWLLARILLVTDFSTLAAVVDLAFLPAIGISIAIPIVRSQNTRNLKILLVLLILFVLNLVFHLAQHGLLSVQFSRVALVGSLDVITILLAIMGGRVIPAFINNAIPGAGANQIPTLEWLSIGTLILILTTDIIAPFYTVASPVSTGLFVIAALANLLRLLGWAPFSTRKNQLLLMLPVAYAWIPAALILRALASSTGLVAESVAFHALTVGAMASMMIAMMTRSALGHTGRPLIAGRWELGAFWLLQCAAVVRVAPLMPWVENQLFSHLLAAGFWSLAFAAFTVRYFPLLTRSRIDGNPG